MNVSGIANQYLSLATLRTNSASSTNSTNSASTVSQSGNVQKALSTATARLEQERQTTTAQISAYGLVKSDFARVQDSGKALAATQSTTSTADVKKNLQAFVSAYNDTRSAAAKITTGVAQAAGRELQRTVSTDSARADLKSLGITQNKDGTLTLDTKALDQALQTSAATVRDAAGRLGSSAQQTATRVLSDTGGINTSLNALTSREQSIESRQALQQQLLSDSQQQVSQASNYLNNALAGITAYNRIFSL